MKQDCTISQSTADEAKRFHTSENTDFQKGTLVSEPDNATGSVVEKYSKTKPSATKESTDNQRLDTTIREERNSAKSNLESINAPVEKYEPVSWSYLFVHHRKVAAFEEQLKKDKLTYFIHKTIRYVPRHKNKSGLHGVEKPTVSGLIFIQGKPKDIQSYLNKNLSPHRLCKNCSTGKVATIPCNQMEPFMRIAETEPDRLRFLLRPFLYYSKNRTLLRIVTGDYAGLEGYVIRIARDRKLVMDVGGMAVAIAGVHAERFEEVNKNEGDLQESAPFYKRNLHERNAFIDRYFHQVKTAQEVRAQVENINIIRLQTLADVRSRKIDLKDAFDTFYFTIEEIVYYYAPFIDYFKQDLAPIFEAGRTMIEELKNIIEIFRRAKVSTLHQQCEEEFEELTIQHGYLFD